MRVLHIRHGGNERKSRALSRQRPHLIHEWSVLRPPIGIKEENAIGSPFFCGLQQDAPKWRDTYSPRHYNGGPDTIVVQPQVAKRALDLDLGAERKRFQ